MSTFRKVLPPSVYSILKPALKPFMKGYYHILDFKDIIFKFRDPLVPPRSKMFVGGGDFKETGNTFLNYFIELGALKSSEHVLDIGCGIGRMAIPLTRYLDRYASYDGFDIVEDGITWCQQNISSRYNNFRFQLADIHNDHYNPLGRYKAEEYKFPYENKKFDFSFLTSVFTHMPRVEVENYIHEIGRVLKPGGRALITFFLINDESRKLMTSSKSAHNIQHYVDGRYIAYPDDPEVCVGFDQNDIIAIFEKEGMHVKIYPGSWCGREQYTSFQDILIAYKN